MFAASGKLFGSELESLEEEVRDLITQRQSSGAKLSSTWDAGWFVSAFTLKTFGTGKYLGNKNVSLFGVNRLLSNDFVKKGDNANLEITHSGGKTKIPREHVGLRGMGLFTCPKKAKYVFRFKTDDGSKLFHMKVGQKEFNDPRMIVKSWIPMEVSQVDNPNNLAIRFQPNKNHLSWKDQGNTTYMTSSLELEKDELILFRHDWYNNRGGFKFALHYKESDDGEYKTPDGNTKTFQYPWKHMDKSVIRHSRLWNTVPLLGYD